MTSARRTGLAWKFALWGTVAALLMLPAAAMRFTDQVQWNPFDFAAAGVLLCATAAALQTAFRLGADWKYRAAIALAILTTLLLLWSCLAVGFFGAGSRADALQMLVIAVLLVGASIARGTPARLALALLATAFMQVAVSVSAAVAGQSVPWVPTFGFALLWLACAALFHRVAAPQAYP